MVSNPPGPGGAPAPGQHALGFALRRAQHGFRRQVNEELAGAGFESRRFPDGRVLAMCAMAETTITGIGNALGITRQGASKIVAGLKERGYVDVTTSPDDGREKHVTLTPRAVEYLTAMQAAAGAIEARLLDQIGADGMEQFFRCLDLLGAGEPWPREGGYERRLALQALRWRDAEGQP